MCIRDRTEEALRYIFGSREAKTPPPNLRSLRQLWVNWTGAVSYTHLRAHETVLDLVCRLLLEKKKHPHHTLTTHSKDTTV